MLTLIIYLAGRTWSRHWGGDTLTTFLNSLMTKYRCVLERMRITIYTHV